MQVGQLAQAAENKAGAIDLRFRVLNNPTQSYLYFFVIGLAMAALQQGIFLAVGAGVQADKASEDFKGIHPATVVLAKLLPYYALGISAFFLTVFVAVQFINLPCRAAFGSLFLLAGGFVFAAVGFSALLASVCRDELLFTRLSIIYTVPAFVLSGYTWPQEAMGFFSRGLSYTFPLSYVSNTMRELMIAGYSPGLHRNSLILFSIGISLTSITVLREIRRQRHG